MKVLEYIQSESDRQKANLRETINMVNAWKYVAGFDCVPNLENIQYIAFLITGVQGYRQTPAVFNQGPPALMASLIPAAMMHWHELLTETEEFTTLRQIDLIMREFLEIHPFADGNGRVASLLYNYLNETIGDPVILPYYFQEK